MLYMNNFYSIEEMDMYSFPPFEAAADMTKVDRIDSVVGCDLQISVEIFKKEIFEKPAKGMLIPSLQKRYKRTNYYSESISRPPTPPDSGSSSPLGPERLRSLIPPPNYGTVTPRNIYRSSFPQDRNMNFMKTMRIRSVLTLVGTEPSPGFQQWMVGDNINQLTINLATNKNGKVNVTKASICQAVAFVEDSNNWPLYIHCNQGKHRTGCVVACYRKTLGWPLDEIIEEYRTYAGAKARDGDIEFIKLFNERWLLGYRNNPEWRQTFLDNKTAVVGKDEHLFDLPTEDIPW